MVNSMGQFGARDRPSAWRNDASTANGPSPNRICATSIADQTKGSSAPAPVKKNPFRTAQNCAAPAISGSVYRQAHRAQMPGIMSSAPTNSADMQYHGTKDG